tara:strand:- start:106 stop:546 length:441 start_codon:yes stop_codon:yes gene_type:complete
MLRKTHNQEVQRLKSKFDKKRNALQEQCDYLEQTIMHLKNAHKEDLHSMSIELMQLQEENFSLKKRNGNYYSWDEIHKAVKFIFNQCFAGSGTKALQKFSNRLLAKLKKVVGPEIDIKNMPLGKPTIDQAWEAWNKQHKEDDNANI